MFYQLDMKWNLKANFVENIFQKKKLLTQSSIFFLFNFALCKQVQKFLRAALPLFSDMYMDR